MVNISVDGKNINANTFVIPPMGLSSSKSHMNQHSFTCEIPKSIIIMITEKELKELREALINSARPLIFFDDDPDGLCAFLQFYKLNNMQ